MRDEISVLRSKEPLSPLISVGAVVIRTDNRRLERRSWVLFFFCPEGLSKAAKAALLDLCLQGARTREGIIAASSGDISMPVATAQRALSELAEASVIIRPTRGRIYVNPDVAFAGPVQRLAEARDKWAELVREE